MKTGMVIEHRHKEAGAEQRADQPACLLHSAIDHQPRRGAFQSAPSGKPSKNRNTAMSERHRPANV
jgi:hypothetical protein